MQFGGIDEELRRKAISNHNVGKLTKKSHIFMNETRDFFGDVSNTIYNILGPGEWYWKSSRVFDDDAFDVRQWKFWELKNSLKVFFICPSPNVNHQNNPEMFWFFVDTVDAYSCRSNKAERKTRQKPAKLRSSKSMVLNWCKIFLQISWLESDIVGKETLD